MSILLYQEIEMYMMYGERSKSDLLAHNEMLIWAIEEKSKGNYLKARKIYKVSQRMKERYWKYKGRG
jgi:hypothetical protein